MLKILSTSTIKRRSIRPLSTLPYNGNGILGVVREEFSMWERRSPLCPYHVQDLTREGFKVIVQPSSKRIFTDSEYAEAGAIISDDLTPASLIIGVKQVPVENIQDGKNYIFFSHTIKAQPQNMKLLDTILERKSRLFDYECITAGGQDGAKRLVAFGKFAGIAGMIDGLQGFGQRLLAEGHSTPFLNVSQSYMFQNLDQARFTIRTVGNMIEKTGFPAELQPMVFSFTGSGNVTKGALEIFELLPHEYVSVADLPNLRADILSGKKKANRVYGVKCSAVDMVRHAKTPNAPFNKADYYLNPQDYVPVFHEKVIPYTTCLVNGFYWDARYPRLLTREQLKKLRASGNKTLRMDVDITCDSNGSVEFFTHATPIEKPFYSYLPEKETETQEIEKDGVYMLGVEILPSELPRDASEHFGQALMPLLPPLLRSKGSANISDFSDLPKELHRACIASHGQLLPKWEYIDKLRHQRAVVQEGAAFSSTLKLTGHLFDSGLINKILDSLDMNPSLKYSLTNLNVKPNTTSGPVPSRLEIRIHGDKEDVAGAVTTIETLVASHPKAEASVSVKNSAGDEFANVKVKSTRRAVLFGSGMVAMPVLKLFAGNENFHLTIASDSSKQAHDMMSKLNHPSNIMFESFVYPSDMNKVDRLVKNTDVVISLLPATMHVPFAEQCVKHKRHMVTASYISDGMQALDAQAKANGIVLLNEVGLDPGIDHMLIMKAVDSIHNRGGIVTELISLCGGLPDPACADNPFRYKFSWSPKGVLLAAGNGAVRLQDGQVITVPAGSLLKNAMQSNRFPTMRMEALPNRDSIKYRDIYGVSKVSTICRGTLRYEGWSNAMLALHSLHLFKQDKIASGITTWPELIAKEVGAASTNKLTLLSALNFYLLRHDVKDIPSALEAIEWLGILDAGSKLKGNMAAIDELCILLQDKLKFKEGEKDMCAMYHSVTGVMPNGNIEQHVSRLLAFGNPNGDSAMAATVGYTTAIGAELLLNGKISDTGVLMPTNKQVYEPMLSRLADFGITYTETIDVKKHH